MKKIFALLFVSSVILLTITSCKKSNSGSSVNNGPHLSKFIEINTTLGAPDDTLEIDTYTYDNSGRWITEEDRPAGDNGYADIADGADKAMLTNSYSGNNQEPNLTVTSEYNQGTLLDTYYDYNTSFSQTGLLLSDSDVAVIPGSPDDVAVYTYSYNGSVVIESATDLSVDPPTQYDTSAQTKVNGNIVSQVSTPYSGDSFTASYDTNPDPFPDATVIFFPSVNIDNIDFGQKNNITEITAADVHTKYTYTYNTNGYPATVMSYDWSSGSPVFVYKGIYVYQ
jgi:hypothetical protein